jgi:hypothetical protein
MPPFFLEQGIAVTVKVSLSFRLCLSEAEAAVEAGFYTFKKL